MEKVKGNLNYMFCFVAVLGIIRNITNIFTKVAYIMMPETLDYDGSTIVISSHLASIFIIVSDLLIVASLILTLLKNKLGLYGFAVVNFLFYVISLAFYEDRLSQLPINLGALMFQYTLFFGLLMIKRNGVRSWNIFFPQKVTEEKGNIEEWQDTAKDVDEKSSHTESTAYANITSVNPTTLQDHSTSLHTEDHKMITVEKKEDNTEDASTISKIDGLKEGTPSKKKEKSISIKRCAAIFLGCVVVTGLVTSILLYHKTCQPEYQYAKADSLFKHGKTNEAIAIFTKLADQEDFLKAKTRLGILYVDNDSVKPNYKLGIKYLEEAKEVDSIALLTLMEIYSPGTQTATKYEDAVKCEKLAKEAIGKGWLIGKSYNILGCLAANKNEFSLAYYNWSKAAEYNYGGGYDNLGWLYFNGNGCPEDNAKARFYWQKALEINNEDDYALYYLGILYEYGYGVDIDLGKAYKYLSKSADLGNDDAKKEVADLKIHHTSVELLGL